MDEQQTLRIEQSNRKCKDRLQKCVSQVERISGWWDEGGSGRTMMDCSVKQRARMNECRWN